MMHLNSIFKTRLTHLNKSTLRLLFFMVFFGFAGFLDATYLTIEHYKNIIPPCSAVTNCEVVLTSQYATFFGIPIALIGALYYATLIATLLLLWQEKHKIWLQLVLLFVSSAMVISIILVAIQAFVLHAFCQYCLLSEAINTILFVVGIILYRHYKAAKSE